MSIARLGGLIRRRRYGVAGAGPFPPSFGPWQTAWGRPAVYASGGTLGRIHARVLADADATGQINWTPSVDSTINRTQQHGTNLPHAIGGLPNCKKLFY